MAVIFALYLTLLTSFLHFSDWRSDFIQTAKAVIEGHVAKGFSGSVLISKNGEVILSEGYGYTSPDQKFAINPRTQFNIASMTKTLTAMGCMILVEKEKINTSMALGEIFPEVPRDKQEISLHQLLTHSSGLPQEYVTSEISDGEKAMKRIWKTSLEFSPGTRFGYSNLNYQILARIIELKSGMSFEQFCRKEIFERAGMNHSSFWNEINHKNAASVAQKLEPFKGEFQDRNWDFLGSGGVFSCIEDLNSFFEAFNGDQLLNSESKRTMLKKQVEIRPGLYCGYGWFISQDNATNRIEYWTRGNESFGHNGVLRWFPDNDLVIIVQSNTGERGSPQKTDNRLVSDDLVKALLSLNKN